MALSCPQSAKNWWAEHSQALCRLGEVLLAFASGVLTIVSFGSPFWIENEQGTLDHEGLWQECQANPAKCNPLSQDRLSSEISRTTVCYITQTLLHTCSCIVNQ